MHWDDPEGWDGEGGGKGEGGSGWGTHVNPWLIHVNVWQNPLQYCKVISLQLIKINGKKKALLIVIAQLKEKKRSMHVCMLTHFSHVQLFCDPMDCSPPDFYVSGILQARILE